MRTIITYGTFDLFHVGHLRLLRRARALGEKLIVGVSTDSFNSRKGKASVIPYDERAEILTALDCVDLVIPETSWKQKRRDIIEHRATVFTMGDDWAGRFDDLRDICEVIYLPRTEGVSSSEIRTVRMDNWRKAAPGPS